MRNRNLFRRLVSLTVAIAMIFTIGTSVFAQNKGEITPGTSITTDTGINYNSRIYYTFTPATTGTYTITAKRYNSNAGNGRIYVYTSVTGASGDERFGGQIGNYITVNSTSNRTSTIGQTLTAGTTYYIRVRSNNQNGTTRMVFSVSLDSATINFNPNGGTGTMNSQTVAKKPGDDITRLHPHQIRI